jgi:hypothetical protein
MPLTLRIKIGEIETRIGDTMGSESSEQQRFGEARYGERPDVYFVVVVASGAAPC